MARAAAIAGFVALAYVNSDARVHGQEVIVPTAAATTQLLEQDDRPGLRLGMFDVYPRVSGAVLYDDNIFSHSIVKESDLIWSISPTATVMLGEAAGWEKSLMLAYTPTALIFTDHDEYTTVNHSAQLSGVWPFSKLVLGFSQSFSQASSVVLGVADRVEQRSYNTRLTSRYEVSEKTSVEVNGGYAISDYDGSLYNNSRTWNNDNWLNYQVLPKFNIGAGLSIGYLDLDRYADQFYQRISARGVYVLTGKTDLTASVGGERREYSGTDSIGYYPVFGLGAVYRPTPLTTVSVNGSRQEQNSAYLADQNYISTGLSASVQHVILERFVASVTGSYSNLEYHFTSGNLSDTRSDDTFTVRPGLDWLISRSWRAGLFYAYRRHTSDVKFYDYASNQVGVQASWAF